MNNFVQYMESMRALEYLHKKHSDNLFNVSEIDEKDKSYTCNGRKIKLADGGKIFADNSEVKYNLRDIPPPEIYKEITGILSQSNIPWRVDPNDHWVIITPCCKIKTDIEKNKEYFQLDGVKFYNISDFVPQFKKIAEDEVKSEAYSDEEQLKLLAKLIADKGINPDIILDKARTDTSTSPEFINSKSYLRDAPAAETKPEIKISIGSSRYRVDLHYNYELPDSLKQKIFDFYLFEYLYCNKNRVDLDVLDQYPEIIHTIDHAFAKICYWMQSYCHLPSALPSLIAMSSAIKKTIQVKHSDFLASIDTRDVQKLFAGSSVPSDQNKDDYNGNDISAIIKKMYRIK